MPYKDRNKQLDYFRKYNKERGKEYWKKINHNRRHEVRQYQKYAREALFILALDVICGMTNRCCIKCKNKDYRCFQFDHINGGGESERRRGLVGSKLHKWIIKNPTEAKKKYQILCANCNQIKKWVEDEHGYTWKNGFKQKRSK